MTIPDWTTQDRYVRDAVASFNRAHDATDASIGIAEMLEACFWILVALYMQKEDEVLPDE